ncbi:MAG: hypothetical protein WD049_02110 [Candidatus Paceibacterota bacterium]
MPAIMTSRQAAELDHAMERNGWTSEDVKKASQGNMLETLRLVVRGELTAQQPDTIIRPDQLPPFDPESFIGPGWTIDEDSLIEMEELDLKEVKLVTMLRDDERYVRGGDHLHRLKAAGHRALTASVFRFLWENKHMIPESWKELGIVTFDGTVLRDRFGDRFVLYLRWRGGIGWFWRVRWLARELATGDLSACVVRCA